MKFGVVVFPGSNCDQDMVDALSLGLGQEAVKLWHKDRDLKGCDLVVLPGGFSFGDYLRAGAIARFSPIMEEVLRFASDGGAVLGICNGFQVLTESHLLPGALLGNIHQKFICKNVGIRCESSNSYLSAGLDPGQSLTIPIAHAEGRYYADLPTLDALNQADRVLFRYCGPEGQSGPEHNPNGSLQEIAGICSPNRRIIGMMPHPERAADARLGNQDGLMLLEGLLHAMV